MLIWKKKKEKKNQNKMTICESEISPLQRHIQNGIASRQCLYE